jgi:hypothetical protein
MVLWAAWYKLPWPLDARMWNIFILFFIKDSFDVSPTQNSHREFSQQDTVLSSSWLWEMCTYHSLFSHCSPSQTHQVPQLLD